MFLVTVCFTTADITKGIDITAYYRKDEQNVDLILGCYNSILL